VHLVHVMEPPVYHDLLKPSEQGRTWLSIRQGETGELVPGEAHLWCSLQAENPARAA
jgi:hypothetical protein